MAQAVGTLVDVVDRSDALLDDADGLVDERHEHPVDGEARLVLGRDFDLAHVVAEGDHGPIRLV